MSLVIAVDGPAASGKGTISRRLAADLGYGYLDTGKLYRAVGARVLDGADPVDAAQAIGAAELDDPALNDPDVARAASEVAADPAVRAALLAFQREYGARPGGAVLDGRDIGTVICPDAPVKLFVTADRQVRAARRHEELLRRGHDVAFDAVLADIAARDDRDAGRKDAPLCAAPDAVTLDTSAMSIDAAVDAARAIVDARTGAG